MDGQDTARARWRIRGPQDFVGGLVLMAVALVALWAARDLAGMRGVLFGPGTTPRLFAFLLLGLGAAIALTGLLSDGPRLARFGLRGPLFVTLAIVAFALMIRPCGLVISGFVAFIIAALGSAETRWAETLAVGAGLTAFCAVLFPYVLGLPMPIWPRLPW